MKNNINSSSIMMRGIVVAQKLSLLGMAMMIMTTTVVPSTSRVVHCLTMKTVSSSSSHSSRNNNNNKGQRPRPKSTTFLRLSTTTLDKATTTSTITQKQQQQQTASITTTTSTSNHKKTSKQKKSSSRSSSSHYRRRYPSTSHHDPTNDDDINNNDNNNKYDIRKKQHVESNIKMVQQQQHQQDQLLQNHIEKIARENHNNHVFNTLFVAANEIPEPLPCHVPNDLYELYGNVGSPTNHNNILQSHHKRRRRRQIVEFPPKGLPSGCLLRIGPNSHEMNESFLDGDGMIHCITIPPREKIIVCPYTGTTIVSKPQISYYTSTYVETVGRKIELQQEQQEQEQQHDDNDDNGISTTRSKTTTTTPKQPRRRKRFEGTLGAAPYGWPLLSTLIRNGITFKTIRCQKDTCNTAIGENDGRLLALMEQCLPTEFTVNDVGQISTVESGTNLNNTIPMTDPITGGSLAAHGRTCPITNEYITVSYGASTKPYGRVDIYHNGFQLKHSIPLDDIDCSVMIHDCAITKHYALVFDFPLTIRPMNMLLYNQFPITYEPQNGARIGLVPRPITNVEDDGNSSSETTKNKKKKKDKNIQWFNVEPGVVLHVANAYEKRNKKDGHTHVVVHALRSEPRQQDRSSCYITDYTTSFLHEWILDVTDGTVISEQCLNPSTLVEFPNINSNYHGSSQAKYIYCLHISSIGGPLYRKTNPIEAPIQDGIVKFCLGADNNENDNPDDHDIIGYNNNNNLDRKGMVVDQFILPKNWYAVSEPTVINKVDGLQGEYILLIASEVYNNSTKPERSHLIVLDGNNLSTGMISVLELPTYIPYGLHSHYVDWKHIISTKQNQLNKNKQVIIANK